MKWKAFVKPTFRDGRSHLLFCKVCFGRIFVFRGWERKTCREQTDGKNSLSSSEWQCVHMFALLRTWDYFSVVMEAYQRRDKHCENLGRDLPALAWFQNLQKVTKTSQFEFQCMVKSVDNSCPQKGICTSSSCTLCVFSCRYQLARAPV